MRFIQPARNFYARFERPISSMSLIAGFLFDIITLKRVDTLWENIWILSHLIIVAVFIVLIHINESGEGDEHDPDKAHFWYVNILQFFFGGLFSTYLVFYFRSADIFSTWPFLLILFLAFVANESLKKHYIRLSFQISLLFLSIYSFMIFLVPIVLHKIGAWVFLLSGILSLVFIFIFIIILFFFIKDKFSESRRMVSSLIFGFFILINFLYFTNLIPPLPLSLKDAEVLHSVERTNDGNYLVTREESSWWQYFKLYPTFTKTSSEAVYVYNAIFSPRGLNINIIHEWEHLDAITGEWKTESTIKLGVVGGRDGGFRTYSMRVNLASGKWKVNIKTEQGQSIGSVRFNILESIISPELVEELKR